ncbi:hypothetical protein Q6D67_08115 [Haliea sp. E1-2-M8]|uniref:hypothetical protein n=1 Tax=Haliea sp. E1-2-M8 TaxID=3064706 RepID=UPI0027157C6E|nr:hypothetical protein [Haliea sp. E1-2-M8]MDO8861664.1 hypothetical protein [Haliea sp. E1-2-M8]
MKDNRYVLFFSHAPQIKWFAYIARTLRINFGLQSVLWVIGEQDRNLGEATGEFFRVVDIIQEESDFARFRNTESATNYLAAYEEDVGCNCTNRDIAMDRYLSRARWTIDKTLVYAAGILWRMRSELATRGQPMFAIGEENCLQYRMARRIVTSPYVCLYMTGHFSDRFYVEYGMYYQWGRCQERYISFLENGVPDDILIKAEAKLNEIVNKKRSPEATERYIESGKGSLSHRVSITRLVDSLRRTMNVLFSHRESWNPKSLPISSNNVFLSLFDLLAQALVKRQLEKMVLKQIPQDRKYAGFFLHVQPEHTVEGVAFEYRDQAATARNIAAALPAGMLLLVKDHVAMAGNRPIAFYNELSNCANIKLLDHNVSPYDVVCNSTVMFTLSGSVALECMYVGKPAIVLGRIYHTAFRGIYPAGDIRDLAELVGEVLNGNCPAATRNEAIVALAAMYAASYPGRISSQFRTDEMSSEANLKCIEVALRREIPGLGSQNS